MVLFQVNILRKSVCWIFSKEMARFRLSLLNIVSRCGNVKDLNFFHNV